MSQGYFQGYSVLRIISWCVLLKVYIVGRVERMRNSTCIVCGYHVGFRIRSTRPTHLIHECNKYLPKYLKLNNPGLFHRGIQLSQSTIVGGVSNPDFPYLL